jgi:hypothetical protein
MGKTHVHLSNNRKRFFLSLSLSLSLFSLSLSLSLSLSFKLTSSSLKGNFVASVLFCRLRFFFDKNRKNENYSKSGCFLFRFRFFVLQIRLSINFGIILNSLPAKINLFFWLFCFSRNTVKKEIYFAQTCESFFRIFLAETRIA